MKSRALRRRARRRGRRLSPRTRRRHARPDSRVLDNLLDVQDEFDLRHITSRASRQPRIKPVHDGAIGQKICPRFRHGHRRQDIAHGDHGAVARNSRVVGLKTASEEFRHRRLRGCSTVNNGTIIAKPDRPGRCLNTGAGLFAAIQGGGGRARGKGLSTKGFPR